MQILHIQYRKKNGMSDTTLDVCAIELEAETRSKDDRRSDGLEPIISQVPKMSHRRRGSS